MPPSPPESPPGAGHRPPEIRKNLLIPLDLPEGLTRNNASRTPFYDTLGPNSMESGYCITIAAIIRDTFGDKRTTMVAAHVSGADTLKLITPIAASTPARSVGRCTGQRGSSQMNSNAELQILITPYAQQAMLQWDEQQRVLVLLSR
jgi:hypothetical protein